MSEVGKGGKDGEVFKPFREPSEFMKRMDAALVTEVAGFQTLELVQRLRQEVDDNGCLNWDDRQPEYCLFRAMVVELGKRLYAPLAAGAEFQEWKHTLACLLAGLAGYYDHEEFENGEMFSVSENVGKLLEAWVLKRMEYDEEIDAADDEAKWEAGWLNWLAGRGK